MADLGHTICGMGKRPEAAGKFQAAHSRESAQEETHQTPGLLSGASHAEGAQGFRSLLSAGLQQLSPPLGKQRSWVILDPDSWP